MILLAGISHHTAPIEERERLAIADAALPAALAALAGAAGVREGMILSTCNRVEILAAVADDTPPDLPAFLLRHSAEGANSGLARTRLYELSDAAAVRHLFRVASSLDSLVVGEPQILGQLKHAYAAAQAAGTIGAELEPLLTRSFHAAKRVRSETSIASQPVSVSQAAVDLARQIFGGLQQKTVLLIGAGAMGEIAARYLMRQGASRLLVANRTLARAQALAEKYGGEAFGLEQLGQLGEAADVIISCTGGDAPLISRAAAAHYLARRRGRPILFLDLAVPRDIEPSVHQLDNAFVYNVDDLDQVVNANRAGRLREAQQAEDIIEAEVSLYLQRRQSRDAVPTVRALMLQAEALRLAELERARKHLGALTPEQEQAVDALTRSLMNKFLHQPLSQLKDAASSADQRQLIELAERLFALRSEKAPAD
ncbi:MAG: glutamyl-tRNA reductase [Terriglobales bacterium]